MPCICHLIGHLWEGTPSSGRLVCTHPCCRGRHRGEKQATPPSIDHWSRPTQGRFYPWSEALGSLAVMVGIAGLMVLLSALSPTLGR